ncbi:MAG: AraC family transcriptional regulator ligand-binding domain-containing protein [Bacteroidota bacterium]
MAFNGRFVDNMLHFAAQRGADVASLYEHLDMSAEELRAEHTKLDNETFNLLMRKTMAMTGDRDFGLHAGEYLNLSAAGIVLQIMQASANIEEALSFVCSLANLGCSSSPMHMELAGDELALVLQPDALWWKQAPDIVTQVMDGIFAFTMREISTLIWHRYRPLRVEYSFAQERTASERERVFGAPISFSASRNAMVLPKAVLDQPILSSDFDLLALLVGHAEKKLHEMQSEVSYASVVHRTILNLVKPQFPTIEEVAANLNQSVRTLQRKLKEEHTTFKAVLEDIKLELSKVYLKRPQLSVAEISELLQYAEPSGFIRSFKRWTGQTPQQFRATG